MSELLERSSGGSAPISVTSYLAEKDTRRSAATATLASSKLVDVIATPLQLRYAYQAHNKQLSHFFVPATSTGKSRYFNSLKHLQWCNAQCIVQHAQCSTLPSPDAHIKDACMQSSAS
jgi:hypothetical protein